MSIVYLHVVCTYSVSVYRPSLLDYLRFNIGSKFLYIGLWRNCRNTCWIRPLFSKRVVFRSAKCVALFRRCYLSIFVHLSHFLPWALLALPQANIHWTICRMIVYVRTYDDPFCVHLKACGFFLFWLAGWSVRVYYAGSSSYNIIWLNSNYAAKANVINLINLISIMINDFDLNCNLNGKRCY